MDLNLLETEPAKAKSCSRVDLDLSLPIDLDLSLPNQAGGSDLNLPNRAGGSEPASAAQNIHKTRHLLPRFDPHCECESVPMRARI